jgi:hypothetical protein
MTIGLVINSSQQDKKVEPGKKEKRMKLCKDPVMLAWAKKEIVKHFIESYGK